ncbi:MAG TPA: cyclopropane fatty acyl phospholipid synthase, partial [Candidatus Udaeobacter sp.]|nr:cyclopropane fatty acyl phospholipid synthase [Candidatus Udaeobacter sp.]
MPLFRSANNGFSNLIGAPRDPTYLKGSRSDHRTTVIQTCFTHTSCNVWMEAKLTMPAASMTRAERVLTNSLATADIRIGGRRRWDIQVHDSRFFRRVLAAGTLGFGESYMDGWWDCEALDEMCCRAIRARLDERFAFSLPNLWTFLTARFSNRQTQRRAKKVGRVHYDLGNDFFEAMLDPNMQYSCALFGEGDDLPAAQWRKLEWICERLRLRPGLRLLDIGCGWGGLARYASRHYGCKVVGVTISKEQFEYARRWCDGLDVEIQLRDYREVPGEFDRVVSVGMVEHVGPKNYRTYFRVVSRYLTNDGLFLCHGIASNSSSLRLDPWIARYIFPNSQLPSMARLARAAEGLFIIDDIANIGPNYDPTLLAWNRNFERAWPRFADRNGERFRRMWRFYLLGCAGAFRAR